jgi:hypothetical protein
MDQHDIDTELASARELLNSTSAGHLAYTAKDGTPRVVTVGFYWTGEQFVISTAATAPKVAALSAVRMSPGRRRRRHAGAGPGAVDAPPRPAWFDQLSLGQPDH